MSGEGIATEAYDRAGSKSRGLCGKYVREAVEAALNVTIKRTGIATDYGPSYIDVGFSLVATYEEHEDVVEGK